MIRPLPQTLQTTYAELVERCAIARMDQEYPVGGAFYRRTLRGRDYWYYKTATDGEGRRRDLYVGPDTPERRTMIEAHGLAKSEHRERRRMVVALLRAGLHGPAPITGAVLSALADAGVFRLRAVVVGSVAFQTYSGLIGAVLSARNLTTGDLDLAQFLSISMNVEDAVDVPFEDILKGVDHRFRAIPSPVDGRRTTRFALGDSHYRIEILTPNRGPDRDDPVALPALKADGQPLRYLDFLIYQEVQAAALHGDGVLINVPAPERYALHKLLVSRLRIQSTESQTKAKKDLGQACELLEALIEQRPYELRDLWEELRNRGPKWRQFATEAVALLDTVPHGGPVRERLQGLVGSEAP